MYLIAFAPLKERFEKDIEIGQLRPHADFIAQSLLLQTIRTEDSGTYRDKPFKDLATAYATIYAPERLGPETDERKQFAESVERKIYWEFIESTFLSAQMQLPLEPPQTSPKKPSGSLRYRVGYAVILRDGNRLLDESCVEVPVSRSGLCSLLLSAPLKSDPATGLEMPAVKRDRLVVDAGTAYLPATKKTFILHVFVGYATAPIGELIESSAYAQAKVGGGVVK
jgi:hypothetical protein